MKHINAWYRQEATGSNDIFRWPQHGHLCAGMGRHQPADGQQLQGWRPHPVGPPGAPAAAVGPAQCPQITSLTSKNLQGLPCHQQIAFKSEHYHGVGACAAESTLKVLQITDFSVLAISFPLWRVRDISDGFIKERV